MEHDASLARSNKIDEICDQFERQWLAGEPRQVEDVLAENTDVAPTRLLPELLLIELEIRRANGESPSVAEYTSRFPEQTDVVDDALKSFIARASHPDGTETIDVHFDSEEETYVPTTPAKVATIVSASATAPSTGSAAKAGGRRFGDYELLHEIARGGMGVVYKARQTKLSRVVALKMIKTGDLAGEEEIQRFQAEAESAAQLDHPGIVPIHEVGEQDGQHFFSMGFVEGASLEAKLQDGPLPPRKAAALIRKIAEAVHYAHEKGIVHRDLKPANVLIDTEGTPKITDFGLAKNIDADSRMTATGQVMGTPSYMPPEQAAGKVDAIGPLADVYSLGAILYATLTGRPPFQAANVMETLRQVLEREPVSPRIQNPAVDRDLETICIRCLEKFPSKRYSTAKRLAGDLQRYLERKPILARPLGRTVRTLRWCRRNKVLTCWIGAFFAVLLYPVVVGVVEIASFSIFSPAQVKPHKGFAQAKGELSKDGFWVYPGVFVEHLDELESIVGMGGLEVTAFRFSAGQRDKEHRRLGGRFKVWTELVTNGKTTKLFEQEFNLKSHSEDTNSLQATYALVRHSGQQKNEVVWRFASFRSTSSQVSSKSKKVSRSPLMDVHREKSFSSKRMSGRGEGTTMTIVKEEVTRSKLLQSVNSRTNISDRNRATLVKAIKESTVTGSEDNSLIAGDLTLKKGTDICLFEASSGVGLVLNSIRRKNGIPRKNEITDHVIRIKCRLIAD